MKKVDNALTELKEALREDELIIAFNEAKSKVENDGFLASVEAKLKETQKLMTINVQDREKHAQFKATYDALLHEYNSHPYVLNFNALLAEIDDLFFNIKTIIE